MPVVCQATAAAPIGSYCGANTTANALVPGPLVVVSGKAAIVEIGQIRVFDSGPDGIRTTPTTSSSRCRGSSFRDGGYPDRYFRRSSEVGAAGFEPATSRV